MKLGKYELKEELGRGGFGVVYRAVDVALEVERAVKVLHPVLRRGSWYENEYDVRPAFRNSTNSENSNSNNDFRFALSYPSGHWRTVTCLIWQPAMTR